MKTILKIFGFFLFALLVSGTSAQNRPWGMPLRERILQVKLREIRKSLDLEQPVFDRFKPVYTAYEKELAMVNFREQSRFLRVNPDSLSAQEAENMVMTQIQHAKNLIALREKYYPKFKTVLTPQQIVKLYQTEAAIRRKVMIELRRRFGNLYDQ
jgi:hypothetical protein